MSLSSLSSLSEEEASTSSGRIRRNLEKLDAFAIYDDLEFKMRFRLDKSTVLHLVALFGDKLQPLTKRNRAIQPRDQILITLRFYATGSYQRVIGDIFKVEQPTVHRIIHSVTAEIAKLKNIYINMPTPEESLQIANNFYAIAGFPRVLGAVGCTHIKINSPGGIHAETFRNRKSYFSFNVQMVCDANLIIKHIIARWPGSVHDSTIFNDSPLCAQFDRGDFGNMVLVGDSGYSCRNYLMTPILNPTTAAEEAYNRAQISTRNPIERLFGVLKRRFPCLHFGLGVKTKNIPPIIVACAVLHNIAMSQHDHLGDDILAQDFPGEDLMEDGHNVINENFLVRTMIINTHFSS